MGCGTYRAASSEAEKSHSCRSLANFWLNWFDRSGMYVAKNSIKIMKWR
jgi:hypothetical protein